jgi:hypothetical protein
MRIYSTNHTVESKKLRFITVAKTFIGSWVDRPYFDAYTLKKVVRLKIGFVTFFKMTTKDITFDDYNIIKDRSFAANDKQVILPVVP